MGSDLRGWHVACCGLEWNELRMSFVQYSIKPCLFIDSY